MRIFKYLKKYWLSVLIAPIMMVGEVFMDLVQPKIMAIMVDNGINYSINGTNNISKVLQFIPNLAQSWFPSMNEGLAIILVSGIFMIVTVILGGTFGVLCGVFSNIAAYKFSNDLRMDAFNKVINLSFEQTDSFTTGSLVTRMTNDVTQVQNMVNQIIRGFIRCLMQFVMGTIFLLQTSVKFGLALLVILPVELVIIILFIRKLTPYFSIVQDRVDDVNNVVQENVTGSRVVKAYNKEEYEKSRFLKSNQNLYDINWKLFKIMSWMYPLMSIFMSGSMVAIYFIGGKQIYVEVNSGILEGLQTGEIMASVTYVTTVMMGFMMLAIMFQALIRGAASIKRLNEILDCTPVVNDGNTDPNTETKGSVEFKDVCFKYPGTNEDILTNINLKINKGETVGILGATGVGKSTLVNLIPRFYDVSSGEILVDGINVKDYKLNDLRDKVKIALQKSELYSGTVRDNICFGNTLATDEEVLKAAKIAQADSFIQTFNEKYDTIVTEKGASLSGGQKQRIAIARAILCNPEIIIFDDSTSALDLETEANLYKELNKEMDDTTLIIIAQRVASVKNADKIVVISDGQIVACAPHEELIKNCDIYIDIYNSQLKKDGDSNGR